MVWWASIFPLSSFATATTLYSVTYDTWFTRSLNFFAVVISTTAILVIVFRTFFVVFRRGFESLLPKVDDGSSSTAAPSDLSAPPHAAVYELSPIRSVAESVHGASAAPF